MVHRTSVSHDHHVLRPIWAVRIFIGLLAAAGAALSAAGLWDGLSAAGTSLLDLLASAGLLVASVAAGLFYATTEVHATTERLWLRRYGFTWWSVEAGRAGTSAGTGADWALIFVFDLTTRQRVGTINWWVMTHAETKTFFDFFDKARTDRGVVFDD